MRPSYLNDEHSFTGKAASSYWNRAQIFDDSLVHSRDKLFNEHYNGLWNYVLKKLPPIRCHSNDNYIFLLIEFMTAACLNYCGH